MSGVFHQIVNSKGRGFLISSSGACRRRFRARVAVPWFGAALVWAIGTRPLRPRMNSMKRAARLLVRRRSTRRSGMPLAIEESSFAAAIDLHHGAAQWSSVIE
jgi:hypothetical protein